ncbi:hypothetical protein [Metabacillus litoralis]|uniref:hypothetical protein n=1 Tax=Metabacillus litoralis TaxID=152268 RepID=UPI001CFD7347|nr:hypothetical protein [Metabacillus litoralis]
MLIVLLAGAILLLMFITKRIVTIEKVKPKTQSKEILQIAHSLFWGLLVIVLIIFIPIIIWKISWF